MGLNTCKVCGKTWVTKKNHHYQYCSDECRAKRKREYNTNYITERRKSDPEYNERTRQYATKYTSQKQNDARWEKRQKQAEQILELAGKENALLLIAEYLDYNFVNKARRPRTNKYASEQEIKTLEELESYGDEYLES